MKRGTLIGYRPKTGHPTDEAGNLILHREYAAIGSVVRVQHWLGKEGCNCPDCERYHARRAPKKRGAVQVELPL